MDQAYVSFITTKAATMIDFLETLTHPTIVFLRYALIAGLLASVSLGMVGTYVVTRRITYIAGAIAHCVLGGIGAALYLNYRLGFNGITPMGGAICAALLAALLLGLINQFAREREDTLIGALWAIGMAIGLLFIAQTPGYIDPMSYLFGNILLIGQKDLIEIAVLDTGIITLGLLLYKPLLAVCFDETFAQLRGLPARGLYLLLLVLTALVIVLLVRLVGIILVIALLTLPAAIAGHMAKHLWQMMLIAAVLSMSFITGGLYISYDYDLPTGPTIILLSGSLYLSVLAVKYMMSRFKKHTLSRPQKQA